MTIEIDWSKSGGLVPAIIQDFLTKSVLMLGYMNKEALEKTLETGRVTFFSRSRQRPWVKGETSGNFLETVAVDVDCDRDTLLISVMPTGPVCHTGEKRCFSSKRATFPDALAATINDRKIETTEGSYTASLFRSGIKRIAQKVGEEAVELALAAAVGNRDETVQETADLVYHLNVLLAACEIEPAEILNELLKRSMLDDTREPNV